MADIVFCKNYGQDNTCCEGRGEELWKIEKQIYIPEEKEGSGLKKLFS